MNTDGHRLMNAADKRVQWVLALLVALGCSLMLPRVLNQAVESGPVSLTAVGGVGGGGGVRARRTVRFHPCFPGAVRVRDWGDVRSFRLEGRYLVPYRNGVRDWDGEVWVAEGVF